MTSFDQIQNHLGVEETALGSLDHEVSESCLGWVSVNLVHHGGRDVGLDGWASADPQHDVVSHVFVQTFIHIRFVKTKIK